MDEEEENVTSETPPSSVSAEGEEGTSTPSSRYRLLDSQGNAVEVSPEEAHTGLADGSLRTAQPLRLRHARSGVLYEVPAGEVAGSLASGNFALDTPEDQERRQVQRELGSAPMVGVTSAASVLRGLDFGTGVTELGERGLGALLGTDLHGDIEALREANPTAATLGEIGGALLTAIPSGGESLLGRAALAPGRAVLGLGERTGAATTRALTGTGAGLGRRIGAQVIGGIVAGGLQMGLGTAAHIATEQALGDDPGDIADRLISSVGLGSLVGGAAHGVGALGREIGTGVVRGAQATADLIARQFESNTGQIMSPGLASLAEAAVRRGIPIAQVLSGDAEGVVPRLFGEGGREARQVLLGGQRIRDAHIREMSEAVSEVASARHILEQSLHGPRKTNALEAIINASEEAAPLQVEAGQRLVLEVRRLANEIDESARAYGPTGEHGPRAGQISSRLAEAAERTSDEIGHALTSEAPQVRAAEIFSSLDQLRRQVGILAARNRGVSAVERAFYNIRSELENEQLWGNASVLQRETNEALAREINWSRDYNRLFMRPGEQEGFDRILMADSRRVAAHLHGAGTAANESAQHIAIEHMRATSDLAEAVIRNRAGVMSPEAIQAAERLRGSSQRLQELYDRATRDIQLQNQSAFLETQEGLGVLTAGGIGAAVGGPVLGVVAAGGNALANPVRAARVLGTFERLITGSDNEIRSSIRSFLGAARGTTRRFVERGDRGALQAERMAYTGAQAYARRVADLDRHRDASELTRDIAHNTQTFAGIAPQVTRALQTRAALATAYLISQQPPGMNLPGTLVQRRHLPTLEAMQRFLRIARAVDHPKSILGDLKSHTLTPEAVQALRTVYPQLYNRIVRLVGEELTEGESEPDYQERLQLGVLLGIPTDPSLVGSTIALLQHTHSMSQQQPSDQQSQQGNGVAGSRNPARTRSIELADMHTTAMDHVESRRIS